MGPLHTIPHLPGLGLVLLGFIGNASISALDHISNVKLIGQYAGNCGVFPKGAGFALWLLIPQTVETLIFRGIRDAAFIEQPGDGGFSISLGEEGKYFPDHCRGLLVNKEAASLLRVLFIAIGCESADMKAAFAAAGQHSPDIFRHILQIPFIDKAVDLAGLFVPLV